MKIFFKPSIILLMICFSCTTEDKNTNTIMKKQDKKEIEQLLNDYKETLNTSDAAKAVSLYTKNGVFMPSGAATATGSVQIKSAYDFVFSQIQLNIDFFIEEITIENNIAFALTDSKGTTHIKESDTTIPEENRELFVLEKENSTWKIARYMFNKTK
jgi:uncharacterized protein (TIGR02246 family)